VLAHGSVLKAIIMILVGLAIGIVGTDVNSGTLRFTFDIPELSDGISIVALFMGMFGVSEIIANLELRGTREVFTKSVKGLLPSREDLKRSAGPIGRGALIGSMLGILPGGGSILGAFSSYMVEKKLARNPQEFGKGAIQGVAGPEAANNAGAQASFIPMLTLGIPGNAVMALMVGAMMIQGIAPGPQVMAERPQLFWGMVASMWIGNLMLVILNLPLIGIWIRLLQVPYRLLYPSILVFMAIGVYSVANNPFDVVIMAAFGLFGLACMKLGMEAAPLALGVVLGPLMEENLRRAMLLARGDPMVFLERPISAGFLITAALVLVLLATPALRRKREAVFQGEQPART
jgi:putative tricarboxylic transport membrane protein